MSSKQKLAIYLIRYNGEKHISIRELDRILLWDLSLSKDSNERKYIEDLRNRISEML